MIVIVTNFYYICDKKGWLWAKKEIPQEWLEICI